jgi:HPt (histidine-containing phosphotransfer) domain-containing protein
MGPTINNGVFFDLSYLNQVFQGNKDLIKQIIVLFMNQVPNYIYEMEDTSRKGKLNELHPLAHKAKSSIAMLGMRQLEQVVLQIEFNSKNNRDLDKIPGMISELKDLTSLSCEQLRSYIAQGNAA